jgi:hypothetical protein
VFSRIDRNGAESNSRKSALSAWYLAARRLLSEPCTTARPSVAHTTNATLFGRASLRQRQKLEIDQAFGSRKFVEKPVSYL